MCMRASLENFGIFTFLNCYFFQYFVGTSDTLSVQMTCLSAYMYRQICKCTNKSPNRHYWGAIAPPPPVPPPPPSGYANGDPYIHDSEKDHIPTINALREHGSLGYKRCLVFFCHKNEREIAGPSEGRVPYVRIPPPPPPPLENKA